MSEIELKLGVPESSIAGVERDLRRFGARTASIESHYWDRGDGRLARANVSLRLRKVAGRWEQTVKAPGRNVVERLEETAPRPGRFGASAPWPDPSLHAGTEAGRRLAAALAGRSAAKEPWLPVHVTRVRRRAATIETGGAVVEVAFDLGTIEAGERALPVCELEIELERGRAAALVAVARASIDAHGMWLSTTAKSTRGERLASGTTAPSAVKAGPIDLHAVATGAELFRAVMANCCEHVLANASTIAAGEVDDDAIHQLRVGLRRMRTAWRELAPWRGALAPGWEAAAAETFRALGDYRDRHTVAGAMERRLGDGGAPEPALTSPQTAASADPVAIVRAARFQHALLDVVEFLLEASADATVDAPADQTADAPEASRALAQVGSRLGRLHARLGRAAKRFDRLDEPSRHRVRKQLKRLRYLSGFVAARYKTARVERFLKRLEPAQDALGHYMDLIIAIELAQRRAEAGHARAWFNVGWLRAQLPDAVRAARNALRRSAAARPFWDHPKPAPRR